MSWAELFERAAGLAVTESQVSEALAERRRGGTVSGDTATPGGSEEDRP